MSRLRKAVLALAMAVAVVLGAPLAARAVDGDGSAVGGSQAPSGSAVTISETASALDAEYKTNMTLTIKASGEAGSIPSGTVAENFGKIFTPVGYDSQNKTLNSGSFVLTVDGTVQNAKSSETEISFGAGGADGSYPYVLNYDSNENSFELTVSADAREISLSYQLSLGSLETAQGTYTVNPTTGGNYSYELAGGEKESQEFSGTELQYAIDGPAGGDDNVTVNKTATGLVGDKTTVTLSIGAKQEQTVSDVVFVLDKSASLDIRKEAASMLEELSNQVEEGNVIKVGVVNFEKGVLEELPLTEYSDANKSAIESAIWFHDVASSGTNIYAGLVAGEAMLNADTNVADEDKHLVLVSDGVTYLWGTDETGVYSLYSENTSNGEENLYASHETIAWHHDPSTYYSEFSDMGAWINSYRDKCAEMAKSTYVNTYEEGQYQAKVNDVTPGQGQNTDWSVIKKFENGGYLPEEVEQDNPSAADIAIYMTASKWQEIAKKYHATAYADPRYFMKGQYPWAYNAISNLGDLGGESFGLPTSTEGYDGMFDSVESKILYEIESGVVTDVIGDEFNLSGIDSFELAVDGEVLEGTVDGNTVSFDEDNYVVTYSPEGVEGDSREQFTWKINTPVVQGKDLTLSYELTLVKKSSEAGKHEVETNESAILSSVSSTGNTTETTFPVPSVTYTVVDVPELDVSKSKTAKSLTKDENGDWVSDVTLSLPSAEYSKTMDVVFVIDDTHSGSGLFADEAEQLLNELASKTNLDISVGVVAFDSVPRDWLSATSSGEKSGLVPVSGESNSANVAALKEAIKTKLAYEADGGTGQMEKIGGTNTEWAVDYAADLLSQGDGEEKYLVMFSDMYGYVYRGTLNVNGVDYSDVPVSKRQTGQIGAILNFMYPKYETWDDVYNNQTDYTSETESFFRDSAWVPYWQTYANNPEIAGMEPIDAAGEPQYVPGVENPDGSLVTNVYYTPFERSACLTYDAIVDAVGQGIDVTIVNNNFNPEPGEGPGGKMQAIKNEMLNDLSSNHSVSLIREDTENNDDDFTSEQMSDIFAELRDRLIQVVDEGSYVVDEMGSGTYDDVDYDFDFIQSANSLSLTVGGKLLKVIELDEAELEGATAGYKFVSDSDEPDFVLRYFKNGWTDPTFSSDYGECFVWEINVPVTKEAQVQLKYSVKLDYPQSSAGVHGSDDLDGDGYVDGSETETSDGLYTNEVAVLVPKDSEGNLGTPQEFPRPTVKYVVDTVIIQPADITIYMGGNDNQGYEGVVTNEDGSVVTGSQSTSLPEPGYYLTLPEDINKELGGDNGPVNLGDHITLGVEEDDTRGWELDRYGSADSTSATSSRFIYRINATGEGQQDVRLQFKINDEAVPEDNFEPAQLDDLQADYEMSIYPGDVNQNLIYAKIKTDEGKTYRLPVKIQSAMLHVRYVNLPQGEAVTDISQPEDGQTSSQVEQSILTKMAEQASAEVKNAFASVPSGTIFTINESSVDLDPEYDPAPSLLFDEVTSRADAGESDGTEYADQLGSRAIAAAASDLSNPQYEARYLDLVDANNGNVWLKASQPVTVYWPYPEGADSSYDFRLVHFTGDGLDRDVTTSNIASAINSADATSVTVEKLDHGVKFTTESFSPFVLVWGASSTTPPDTGDDKGDLTIKKEITGDQKSADDVFTFQVTVDGAGNQKFGNVQFTNDVATIYLKGGESITISDLPEGADYAIVETDARGYELVSATNDDGEITDDEVTATFTNDKSTPDEPDDPDEPDNPDDPDEPDEPDNPDEPDEPDNPDEPDEPDNPGTPDTPGEPSGPGTPSEPSRPERPSTPTSQVPDTGDHTSAVLPVALVVCGVALVGGGLVIAKRRAN